MAKTDFDAIVVGSGPNGLSAAVVLQQAGLSTLLVEREATIGGGLRSAELTLPGAIHDVCSAVHPLAVSSPFFQTLPLDQFGLRFIYPPFAAAHPFDDGTTAMLEHNITATANRLGTDQDTYTKLFSGLLKDWRKIYSSILAPLTWPRHPLEMLRFGLSGMQSATHFANREFLERNTKGLWAGMAAHSKVPLTKPTTAAIALVLMLAAHDKGWPIPEGGSQQIANALAAYFVSLGGKIETKLMVTSLKQLPSARAILFDVDPTQLLRIAGHRLSALYKWQLSRYRYGPGIFKIDWALADPIPFSAVDCRESGTVHLGNTLEEIAAGEQEVWEGKEAENPFVLIAQPSLFDPKRTGGKFHTAWGYCHVPNGSSRNMTTIIERQVERFAPGFRDRILARHIMKANELEEYNPNYAGGDINTGVQDLGQLFTRPALRFSPYRTSAKGLYLCSSATPPGGGVHGMCGWYAAKRALKDVFNINIKTPWRE